MEWFALIIPALSCVIAFMFFRKQFAIWEYPIPSLAVVIAILICKLSVKTALVDDTEYWGSLVVKARYYEYWETWVEQTCSYSCNCTTDKDGYEHCQTCYRDCSYCDENGAYWVAYDDAGRSYPIREEYYKYLINKWSGTPRFIELNRDIDYHSGFFSGKCGKDGDAYEIVWDGKIESSEAAVNTYSYTNKVQASHSTFKLPNITKQEAQKLGLFEYPKFYDHYKQPVVLGLDTLYNGSEKQRIETIFQYFNGYYGSRNKVKLFLCLFYDKPLSIGHKQQAYWDGGNQNELVVCIGLKRTGEINWVYPFSWTDQKRVLVDCREDIAELKTFKPDSVYLVIENAVKGNLSMYKNFKKDFSYLRVELPGWSMVMIWILTFVVTIGSWIWCLKNEVDDDLMADMINDAHKDLELEAQRIYQWPSPSFLKLDKIRKNPLMKKKFKRRKY